MATTSNPAVSWCMNGGDDFSYADFSEIDGGDLLMSFLDDTHVVAEDYDDERLKGVIKSLEAEIVNVDNGLFEGGQRGKPPKASQPSDAGQLHSQDLSKINDLDLAMMDMTGMEMEPHFPTTNDGINGRYLEQNCRIEMDGVDEEEYCNGVNFQEISYHGYLWPETNVSDFYL
ncbi:unnamed protein product [Cuscuta epithymum]|uniref:Uncharacterized protein n=1 Tax=Cuscuta epithymum TaxID=186058 RepID=A0AAV0DK08_9ASTE|nr:unnamed protein product [Cuscuta epithymum]